jgi:Nif-specific regulatory protein
MSSTASPAPVSAPPDAYLVVQRGSARVEVVPLTRGTPVTVGRANTNRIVVADGKCSRQHCEVFSNEGRWFVRDLGSRNGITIDGQPVDDDWELEVGQRIGLGGYSLLYTDANPEDAATARIDVPGFSIIERKSGTRFDTPLASRPEHGRHDYLRLFQLARMMQSTQERGVLCQIVLDALLEATHADSGAVLASQASTPATPADMELICVSGGEGGRIPVSDFLTEAVLKEREGLLAHNVTDHSVLRSRDSLRDLAADSAICAPIRQGDDVFGVVHLYSRRPNEPLSADDLEFTLAVADQLGINLRTLQERSQLEEGLNLATRENAELREQLDIDSELVGKGKVLEQLRRKIGQVAPTDATVLIRGESGVGKELVARALHRNSFRKGKPFVCVNCAALTETLLESELFGHEKGAFTGASNQRAGKFEQAHQGTLFLDEIGEMSPEVQSKFLRILEGQPFERVGGGQTISVDVRVVTATNRNLEDAVNAGKFRSDLYYRLQVIEIDVPPLREHPEDIPVIAQHFVERYSRRSRLKVKGFNHAAVEVLCGHYWPGNVRELRNVVERAVILSTSDMLGPEDIQLSRLEVKDRAEEWVERPTEAGGAPSRLRAPEAAVSSTGQGAAWNGFIRRETTLDDLERLYIEAVLDATDWNKSQAAKLLGIERTTLDRRLKKYGLRRPRRIAAAPEDDDDLDL